MTLNLYIWLHNLWETNIKLCCLYAYFLTWITRVLKVVLVSIDMETVLDLRHLLIVTVFPKRNSLLAEINRHESSIKTFWKGGGTYMKSWHAKKKSPSFPKNLQNPNSVGEGGGWSEEKKWDGDRPTPLPNALTPMLCVWSMLNLRGGSPLWSPTSIKMSVSVVGFWI